jgi:hypothetical protein
MDELNNCDTAELLRDVREALAWHWEATSGPERENKENLLARIDSVLAEARPLDGAHMPVLRL